MLTPSVNECCIAWLHLFFQIYQISISQHIEAHKKFKKASENDLHLCDAKNS